MTLTDLLAQWPNHLNLIGALLDLRLDEITWSKVGPVGTPRTGAVASRLNSRGSVT